jgi:hypothetical protein
MAAVLAEAANTEPVRVVMSDGNKIKAAQGLAKIGKFLEAADLHPTPWVKAWYYLNHARSHIGAQVDGKWVYNEAKMKDPALLAGFEKYVNAAEAQNSLAWKSGVYGKGGNAPEKLDEYINGYRALIKKYKT